jgi:tetratricopeptide (TPR) repeat protein
LSRILVRLLIAVALLGVFLGGLPLAAQEEDIPEVARSLIEEGDRHLRANRVEDAVASYQEAQRLAPSSVATYVALGALYSAQGEHETAYDSFREGLRLDPDNAGLLFNAAVLGLRLERYDEALVYVEKALKANRKEANLHAIHGAILRAQGHLDEALTAFESAVKLDRKNPSLYFRLGNLYNELDRHDQAVEAYQLAIRQDKTYLRAWYNLGTVLYEVGNYPEALAAYRVALQPAEAAFRSGTPVDVSNAQAFLNLGGIHFHRQDWTAALDAYGKALRLDPKLLAALYNQGYIHFQEGRDEEARKAYLGALELDDDLPLAYFHLGQIQQRRGQPGQAVEYLSKALPRLDEAMKTEAHLTLARAQRALGETAAAMASYRHVVEADPQRAPALVELGRLLRLDGDAEAARELLERAKLLSGDDDNIALELALLARSSGEIDREEALYQEILQRSPEMWPVRLNLGLVLLRRGDRPAARREIEPLVARLNELRADGLAADQAHLVATAHALLLAADADLEGARRVLGSVLAEDPGLLSAATAAAVLEARAGNAAAAVVALSQAHQDAAEDPVVRANLAKTLYLAGRGGEARGFLEASAAAEPDQIVLRAVVGEIALAERDYSGAAQSLAAARQLCASPPLPAGPLPAGSKLRVTLAPEDAGALCRRIDGSLATAYLGSALGDLSRARQVGARAAGDAAGRALELGLADEPRAVALFVRGTARLMTGVNRGARDDLRGSLGLLPKPLVALARNNLGVALLRLGETEASRRELEAARAAGTGEATLNLAILLDDHANAGREALGFYEEYLKTNGRRRQEAQEWAQRLRRVYQ